MYFNAFLRTMPARITTLAAGACLFLSTQANAVLFYSADVILAGCNLVDTSLSGCEPLIPRDGTGRNDGIPISSSLSGELTINGIDALEQPASMNVVYEGSSEVIPAGGIFKVGSSLSLIDPFYNPENDPFVFDKQFNVDPNGAPEDIFLRSFITYRDTGFSITGDPSLSYITISLAVEGFLTRGELPDLDSTRYVTGHAGFSITGNCCEFQLSLGQPFIEETLAVNETIDIPPIPVVNGIADVRISIESYVDFQLTSGFEPGSALLSTTGASDFLNTISILSFNGFDADGNPVDLFNVTDSTGFTYVNNPQAVTVPLPATVWLLSLGLIGMARKPVRMRASSAAASPAV